jgi:hypothetical protein
MNDKAKPVNEILARPGGYKRPTNLWDQLRDDVKATLALLLGFDLTQEELLSDNLRGFRMTLGNIPCLPPDFTIGDALQAYLEALGRRFPDARPRAEEPRYVLLGYLPPRALDQGPKVPAMLWVYPSETQAVGVAGGVGRAVAIYTRSGS